MKFKKILLSLLICLSCFVQAKNITISRLTCEMQEGLVVQLMERRCCFGSLHGRW